MTAAKRLEQLEQFKERLEEARRQQSRAASVLLLAVEQLDGMEFEINKATAAARRDVLDEQAHHMDHHPTELSVLRGGR